MRFLFIVYLVVEALSFLLLTTQVTIHPVVTATSSAASTAMNAPSITSLLLLSTVADIFGVILKCSVMTAVVVEHDGAGEE